MMSRCWLTISVAQWWTLASMLRGVHFWCHILRASYLWWLLRYHIVDHGTVLGNRCFGFAVEGSPGFLKGMCVYDCWWHWFLLHNGVWVWLLVRSGTMLLVCWGLIEWWRCSQQAMAGDSVLALLYKEFAGLVFSCTTFIWFINNWVNSFQQLTSNWHVFALLQHHSHNSGAC